MNTAMNQKRIRDVGTKPSPETLIPSPEIPSYANTILFDGDCEDDKRSNHFHVFQTTGLLPLAEHLNLTDKNTVWEDKRRKVSCKARGLSSSHNPKTAFFRVPKNCPHGAILTCSYPKCSKSGRQFRYCRVCDDVVSKRNFMRRHGHGIMKQSDAAKKRSRSGTVPPSQEMMSLSAFDFRLPPIPFSRPSGQDEETTAAGEVANDVESFQVDVGDGSDKDSFAPLFDWYNKIMGDES